ncbi:hypothetical protein WJX81_005289 [Elliptochloris bilobata]|uniref:WPP domain-containing protein n=1 Tax=Elliptochloris bilobata TaxID=381761 RepID=A0AAW1QNL4_9CHLO
MAAAAHQEWQLSAEQRDDTVARVAQNLASLTFFAGGSVPDSEALRLATEFEKKAYTVARVEARTTTGTRPHAETFAAYTRKLASLLLEASKARSAANGAADASGGVLQPAAAPADASQVDLTGVREFLVAETAQEALASMLAEGAAVSRIKLSTKSFGAEAAGVAADAIANCAASLTHADLSDVIAGRPEAEALDALRILSNALAQARLKVLDLSDNALGEKGVRACAAALSNQAGLERLAFQNVGCSIAACRAIAELLTDASSLAALHLHNNMSDNEGAAAIAGVLARAPALQDFRMTSSRVGPEGGIALAQGLSAGRRLVRLDLSGNTMTADAAPGLAQALRGQQGLRALYLNDAGLGDEGVAAIAEALAEGSIELEELELAFNDLTEDGAASLAAALWRRVLPALQELDLCQNQIRRAGALAVAKAVAAAKGLRLLALDENEISDAGVDHLKAVLKAAGQLGTLGSLEDNDADAADEAEGEEDEEDDDGEAADTADAEESDLAAELARATKIA